MGVCRTVLEGAAFQEAKVHPNGVEISVDVQSSNGAEQRAGGAGGTGAQLQVSQAAAVNSATVSFSVSFICVWLAIASGLTVATLWSSCCQLWHDA